MVTKSLSVKTPDGQSRQPLGDHPAGYTTFSKGGHLTYVGISNARPKPSQAPTDAEAAALFRTLNAYAGTYRLQGKDTMLVHIEDAWLPSWNGLDQVRKYTIKGRELVMVVETRSAQNGAPVTVTATLEKVE